MVITKSGFVLGMECIDKGMYQKWINKNEAEIEVLKEKI